MRSHPRTTDAAAYARRLRKDLTSAEVRLWQRLRRNQLGTRFRRQEPIGPYIVDFVGLRHGLVIELDGPHHERVVTKERTMLLHRLGFRVLRFDNEAVAEGLDSVVEVIRQALNDTLEPERFDEC